MQIQKVLNNNVVVALDENGAETVLMGRGLGFGCKAGDEASPAKIEKRFSLHSDQLSSRFQQLITSIPLPHFMMSERIINHAKLSLGRELSDSIYVTLPDHISGAISRYQRGDSSGKPASLGHSAVLQGRVQGRPQGERNRTGGNRRGLHRRRGRLYCDALCQRADRRRNP